MSHIVSLRSASLRALRSNLTTRIAIAATTKCTINPPQNSFSTFPLSSTNNKKFTQRVSQKKTKGDIQDTMSLLI